jgi:hypothetical protein
MKRQLKSGELKRLDRMFWIVIAIALPLMLASTYFYGFQVTARHRAPAENSASAQKLR